jgi:hypothetical protein
MTKDYERDYFFPEDIQNLKDKIEELQQELDNIGKLERKKFSKLAFDVRIWKKVIDEELGSKAGESLLFLDSFELYRLLQLLLLELVEKLQNPIGEKQHSDAEIRGVYFLYLLSRFLEDKKHFPHKLQMKKLFDDSLELISLDSLLSQAEFLSPLTRNQKAKQRRTALRNCVGVGDDGK